MYVMGRSILSVNYKVVLLIIFLTFFIILFARRFYHNNYAVELDYAKIYVKANLTHLNRSIHVTKLFSTFTCSEKPIRLLVVVTSEASNFKQRNTIRKTWGKHLTSHTTHDFRTYFAVGKSPDQQTRKKVKKEMEQQKDVILGDFYEDYYQLTTKSETVFEWAYKHCDFDYLLKADDDVYINLSVLFEMLNHPSTPKHGLYTGLKHVKANVFREGKLAVSYEEYGTKNYPDFCSGGSAIFSQDVVKRILPYLHGDHIRLEDVYTGMLMMNAGVTPRHLSNVRLFEKDCTYRNSSLAHHSKKHTKKVNCILKLFYSMLAENVETESSFVRMHYINVSNEEL